MKLHSKKILLTGRSGQFAGVERRMLQEAHFLAKSGYDVTIGHSSFPGDHRLVEEAEASHIKTMRIDFPPFLHDWRLRHVHYLRHLATAYRSYTFKDFDLVHIFMAWSNAGLEHIHTSGKFGVPFVISAHNAFPKVATTSWHRRFLTSAFNYCAGVYGVSSSAVSFFETGFAPYIPETAIRRTIHNFVDTDVFIPCSEARISLRKQLGIRQDSPLVGCIGRLSEHKRPIYTLRIFAKVADLNPDTHFIFVGEGDLLRALHNEINELDIRERVHVLPFSSEPHKIFPALDVHVLLSKIEGFGISTVESLSCRVPVVATAVPGSEEVLKHNKTGYLVDKNDACDAVEAISKLINDTSLRARFGEAGRLDCKQHFSREVWERRIAGFYDSVFDPT